MKKWLLALVILFISLPAIADWKVSTRTDSMTDEKKKTAIVKNSAGHSFSIYRLSKGGSVMGNFALADKTFDQVDWEKPPIYRIDKNAPIDLQKMKKFQSLASNMQFYDWTPKWVNFRIWHGKKEEGIGDKIVQLMEGKKVVFRYYLFTGGYKETSFTLKGSTSAIAQAIGIGSKVDHAKQGSAKKFRKAIIAETNKCRSDMSTFNHCFSRVKECGINSNNNTTKFKECIE